MTIGCLNAPHVQAKLSENQTQKKEDSGAHLAHRTAWLEMQLLGHKSFFPNNATILVCESAVLLLTVAVG